MGLDGQELAAEPVAAGDPAGPEALTSNGTAAPLDAALADKEARRSTASRSIVSAGAYSVGFAVQRAIGIVMLPFYTRAISTTQYGELGILLSVYAAVSVLFAAGLEPWIVRNYFQTAREPDRRQHEIDSAWRFLTVYPLLASFGLAAVVWPFLSGSHTISSLDFALMLVAAAVGTAATALPLSVLRAQQNLRGYMWITGVTALGTPAVTAVLVVFLHEGVRGWFVALLVANAAAFVTAMFVVPWHPRGRYSWKTTRVAVIFSLPLIPHFISSWALQLADRLVIAGIVSTAQLGIYSLASNLASPVLMLMQALNQGTVPTYARAGAEPGHERDLDETVIMQLTVVVAITLAGAMFGSSAVSVLTPPSYHAAAALVPWIVLGYGFVGAYYVPMNGATVGAGRRNFAWVASASSAATNVALLVLFVPRYGVYAAAVASAAGYLVLLALMAIWAHSRENPVRYDWGRILPVLALGGGCYVGAVETATRSALETVSIQVLWFACFAAGTIALRRYALRTARAASGHAESV